MNILTIVSTFIVAGTGFSMLIFCAAFLLAREKKSVHYWGMASFALLAAIFVISSLVHLAGRMNAPNIMFLNSLAGYYLAPCLFFYLSLETWSNRNPSRWFLLLFIPAIAVSLSAIPFYLMGADKIRAAITAAVEHRDPRYEMMKTIHILSYSWNAAIFALLLYRNRSLKKAGVEILSRFLYHFALAIFLWMALFSATIFSPFILASNIFATATPILVICLEIFIIRHPWLVPALNQSQKEKAKYKTSKTDGLDIPQLLRNMEHILGTEKPFLSSSLTLTDMSARLKITPHQLSELLNRHLNVSFTTWVNDYRIREACRTLSESPDRKILDIALTCGFQSKSTFNQAFLNLQGLTPSEYRKKVALSKENDPAP